MKCGGMARPEGEVPAAPFESIEMSDAQIAFSIAKMKEYGIVDSGDSIKLRANDRPTLAQATPPLQSTPGAESKPSAPSEPATDLKHCLAFRPTTRRT